MVHAVHHQARQPLVTSIDSLLLHPLEAFIGIALFIVAAVSYVLAVGEPF